MFFLPQVESLLYTYSHCYCTPLSQEDHSQSPCLRSPSTSCTPSPFLASKGSCFTDLLHTLVFELLWRVTFSRAWHQPCHGHCLSMIMKYFKVSVSSLKEEEAILIASSNKIKRTCCTLTEAVTVHVWTQSSPTLCEPMNYSRSWNSPGRKTVLSFPSPEDLPNPGIKIQSLQILYHLKQLHPLFKMWNGLPIGSMVGLLVFLHKNLFSLCQRSQIGVPWTPIYLG